MKRLLQLTCLALLISGGLIAQPANDNCSGAIDVPLAADEGSAVLVDGDTRGGTGDANVPNVCSGSWFGDDIWYSITTGADLPARGIVVRTYFGTESDDVPAVGMAFYRDCGMETAPWACFSSDDPTEDRLEIDSYCLTPNTTYYVRVWSGVSPTDNSGTLRISAYANTEVNSDVVLWEETFADSLTGWTTLGTCAVADSNENARWHYLPDGLVDKGNFIFAGAAIASPTVCDGAVGVDSDFDDNGGTGDFGAGPCPAPGQYILVSPALYSGDWDVAGITATWTQAIRQFQSTYFISYRTNTTGGTWSDWTDFQINLEHETNGDFVNNDVQRLFLGGAQEGDSLQIRFVYNANYYMWAIDDFRLVETEANNMRSMANWFATAPARNVPVGQERNWIGMNDVFNAGATDQTNVMLNLTVSDSEGSEIYNETIPYGTIAADSLAENVSFPSMVDYSGRPAQTYTGVYTVTSDSCMEDTDFDFTDNQNTFTFSTNDASVAGVYELEDAFTGAFNVATTLYDDGAPWSWTWGNYMYFPNGSELTVDYINWGISNPDAIPGQTINVILFKWSDLSGDQIVQANERSIKGFASVLINGDEGDNVIFDTPLENFEAPGDPIQLEDGGEYLAMIEYNATAQTSVFLHASEEFDYGAVAFSSEVAWQGGMGMPAYMGVLGHSSDGNVQGIDYEVTEFGDDGRTFFGFDIVPAVKMYVKGTSASEDLLGADNVVDLFPNPANRTMNVRLDLADQFEQMELQVIDVTGKIIETQVLNNFQNQNIEMNVSQYANGAYILKLQTEKGIKTKRFVVQH